MRITTYTEDPIALVRYRDLRRVDGAAALTVVGGRAAKGELIARASGVADRDQAEALRGLELYVPRDMLPELASDEFYLADLIGLKARDASGATIGTVKAADNFGAGDLLEIAPGDGGPSWWLPFSKDAVLEVRIADGWIVIAPPAEAQG